MGFFPPIDKKGKQILWVSLAIHVVTAWFSVGCYQGDEHWQLLEFANYKLGLSPASDLPWEFAAQIRPSLQPWIAFIFAKAMMILNAYNPFTLAFILRLITALLSWMATVLAVRLALDFLKDQRHVRMFILFSTFLWFLPYIHVRFSGEVWSGLFFFFGLYILLGFHQSNESKGWIMNSILIGLFWGISFWCRFQIAFAMVGAGFWLVIYNRQVLLKLIPACLIGILILGAGVYLDFLFYNDWVFTPYKYFESNIINNVAANWGVSPWWEYFVMFILNAGIPLSLVLFSVVMLSIVTNPKSLYVWILIAFIGGHMLVGHKELRFLFPMVYLFPLCALLCVNSKQMARIFSLVRKRGFKISYYTLLILNFILLAVVITRPSSEGISFYQYVYEKAENSKLVKVLTTDRNPYSYNHPPINFYRPLNVEVIKISQPNELFSHLKKDSFVLFFSKQFDEPPMLNSSLLSVELKYQTLPAFVKKIDFNGWVERTNAWCLYEVTLKNP